LVYIVPFFVHQRGWVAFAAGVIHMSTSGFIFGIFSQVGHITELALARDVDKSNELRHAIAKGSWAAEQIETTNDYCAQSRFWFVFGHMLNVQCEHHLFPSLNHCHLQLIQPTVEQCCKEYNVAYKNYSSFSEIFKDTVGYIQSLGRDNEAKTKKIQ
jgi:fatty acid desaturase